MAARRLGVDTGGTFTDVVTAEGRVVKLLSTPEDPAAAVMDGVEQAGGADALAHGTTVATNTLLERGGARVALYATEGHTDVIEIARQVRPSLYDPFIDRPEPLVPRHLRRDVPGRLDHGGHEVEPLGSVESAGAEADAAAIVLLHADRNPAHELALAERLRDAGTDVSASHELSPEFREYERTVTTVANAYLRPPCRRYLLGLADAAAEVLVMTSAGGLIPVAEAAERPVALLLSGPAGGVLAAAAAAEAAGFADAVTLDMGGTSTDVCLIRGGRPEPAAQRVVAGLPIRMPSLDVHTIGAGGGSIARLDSGGALVVGPASAGAIPGPACYRLGGECPTVTDADLVAGRIPPEHELPGLGRLDTAAATQALAAAGVTAEGVIAVVDANMVRAVRRVSVERGVDPRHLALVAFGGAGPLHACALADALDMPAVVVPARAGVLSAAGMLAAPRQVDLVRSWPAPDDHPGAEAALGHLAAEAAGRLAATSGTGPVAGGGTSGPGPLAGGGPTGSGSDAGAGPDSGADLEVETWFDCRYAGQGHELSVATIAGFGLEHERRNGFSRPGAPVEVVALRASARRPSPINLADLADAGGRSGVVTGPAVIAEADCTVWVAPGWTASVGGGGAWVLTRDPATPGSPVPPGPPGSPVPPASPASPGSPGSPGSPPRLVPGHMGDDPLDPAGLQVLISQLTGVAEEMGAVLRRASFSPNIKERADCSAALFTADGQLLVQAEHIPVHLGSMPASVVAAIDAGLELGPGDQIVLNDPFAGGTHLNDITLVAPCFLNHELVGWAANRAHHADLGGMSPGSMPPEAVEIYQEGLRIPPVVMGPQVVAMVLANSRTPEERRGDLDAQVGANVIGVERLRAIVAGGAPLPEVLAYGERRMRAALTLLADGQWQVEDVIDSVGPRPEQQRAMTIRLKLTKTGDEVSFDFSGTDDQQPGNVNAVEAVTYSAVAFALRSATDPTIPANGGALRPITLRAPAGTIVAARPPAAVGAGNVEVSQRVADVCLKALAQAAPGRVGAAGQGTMNNVILSGVSGWVYYETVGGGQGGRPGGRAGMNGVHTAMTNTADTPTEALERSIPVRVLRYRLRPGSGGAGQASGGEGIERVIQVLEPSTASIITERRASRPWGLEGGEPGQQGENWLWPGGVEAARRPLLDKMTLELEAGDAIQLLTPGGGGFGAVPSAENGRH